MATLIDKEALLEALHNRPIELSSSPTFLDIVLDIMNAIRNRPIICTIDDLIPKGYWIEKEDDYCGVLYNCSVCGIDYVTDGYEPEELYWKYCPNCGAKMEYTTRESEEGKYE